MNTHTAIAISAAALLASACAPPPWPDGEAGGRIKAGPQAATTLFMPAVAATDSCAATRLAVAMGISRRGYFVLAQPQGLKDAFTIDLECEETQRDVELWQGKAAEQGSCVAPGIEHLKLAAWLHNPGGKLSGPITWQGHQRVYPAPLSQGCRYDVEPLTAMRKRAGEDIGWRFPPGPVDNPGADPRLILSPPQNGSPSSDASEPREGAVEPPKSPASEERR